MPRFVILAHDWPAPHWDFLVEAGGVLRAWRLLGEPRLDVDIAAEPNYDHRLLYLEYEGPLTGGRGSVARWDNGTCSWLVDEPDRVVIVLCGAKVAGHAVLARTPRGWLFRLTAPVG
jgi:hypothetical protein